MRIYPLDKTMAVDTLYRAERDKFLLIESIGTNSTTRATLRVGGAPCAETLDQISPLRPTASNLNEPLALNPLRVVVPPDKPFDFLGSPGSYMRVCGKLFVLEPAEEMPAAYRDRAARQAREYISYQSGTYSSAAAAAIGSGAEFTVLTFTCPAGERWTFNRLLMAEVWTTADTIKRELLTARIYVDDLPLDVVEPGFIRLGLYGSAAPRPPRDAVNVKPFSLKDFPIELTAGRTLKITAINTGSAATLATGETLEARVEIVGERAIL